MNVYDLPPSGAPALNPLRWARDRLGLTQPGGRLLLGALEGPETTTTVTWAFPIAGSITLDNHHATDETGETTPEVASATAATLDRMADYADDLAAELRRTAIALRDRYPHTSKGQPAP